MKIRTQMILIGMALSILPLALVSVLLINVYEEELSRVVRSSLKSITTSQAQLIDNFFYERDKSMAVLSELDLLHDLLRKSNDDKTVKASEEKSIVDNIFNSNSSKLYFVDSITAVDKDLNVVACSEPVLSDSASNIGTLEGLDALGKDTRFSRIMHSGELGAREKCLIAIRAIYNDEELLGYMIEEISLEFFEDLRINAEMLKEAVIYIIDGQGGIITAGQGDSKQDNFVLNNDERSDFNKAWLARDLTERIGVIEYAVSGKNYLTSYSGFTNARWQIMSSVCIDNILLTREKIIAVIIVALVAAGVLAFVVNKMISKTVTKPILQMIQTFAEIRGNMDFSLRLSKIGNSEIATISSEVNALLGDIEATVQQQKANLATLKKISERDGLSGLFNKNTIEKIVQTKLEGLQASQRMCAFLLLDIDDFKSFNTLYGHLGGDEIIKFVAQVLKDLSGDTAGRIGGDEFVLLLDFAKTQQEIEKTVETLLNTLRMGVTLQNGVHVEVPCSIGAAIFRGGDDFSLADVFEKTDQAMYIIKKGHKDGYLIV